MRLIPRFRDERILREQVSLVYQNFVVGTLGYFFAAAVATFVVGTTTNSNEIYPWFFATGVVTFGILFRYWVWAKKGEDAKPINEAKAQVYSMLTASVVWSILPLYFLNEEHTAAMVGISILTIGVTAAGLIMQSACLPIFLAFSFTLMPPLCLAFIRLDSPAYTVIGYAGFCFFAVMVVFAVNLEAMIKQSIELRFKNLDLIDQLKDSMEKTEEANRVKTVFLASASHDLRQPLHAMGLFIETLKSTESTPKQSKVISHIENASQATIDMLDVLLDFSKIDAGVIEAKPSSFHLQTMFDKLEVELGGSANLKNLFYRTRETAFTVYADITLVELILRNLISNAIRYTESGGVLIACRHRGSHAVVEIWDTGIGIAEEDQKNIFREFHQLANPERDRKKGFGLGLAIVDGLAKKMNLELSLSSRVSVGSVFRLYLPISKEAYVEELPETFDLQRFDGQSIIVIDDDESNLLAMQQLLLSWGCKCLLAESCDEALQVLQGEKLIPDLIITDYRLREQRTGGEAIIDLRKSFKADIPAIIITGDTSPDRLRDAQAHDALLLHKPVAASDLQKAMGRLLAP